MREPVASVTLPAEVVRALCMRYALDRQLRIDNEREEAVGNAMRRPTWFFESRWPFLVRRTRTRDEAIEYLKAADAWDDPERTGLALARLMNELHALARLVNPDEPVLVTNVLAEQLNRTATKIANKE